MKIVCASDSFKGSLTSEEICKIITKTANTIFASANVIGIPMADGGEGTLDALLNGYSIYAENHGLSSPIERIPIAVRDPLGRSIMSEYGRITSSDSMTAVIELAKASGLTLLESSERCPLLTSTYGTGQMIRDAVTHGARKLIIGIGGSATNDGGTGAMEALGAKFYDADGKLLSGNGENLIKIARMEWDRSPWMSIDVNVMCDVKNPLTGSNGATRVYGSQKGATPEMLDRLEQGMMNYASVLSDFFGTNVSDIVGGGAAGGIGAALSLFLGAKLKSGAETILHLYHFPTLIKDADLVITGEGSLDSQTANGKVVSIVADYCAEEKIPCCAVVGRAEDSLTPDKIPGITEILSVSPDDIPLEESMLRAAEFYETAIEKLFSDMKAIYCFIERKNP